MFKCFNNVAPTYLSDKFHKVRDLHNIYTRQAAADNLSLPKFKLAKAQNSFSFKGAKLWNSLPISIKSSKSLSVSANPFPVYQFHINYFNSLGSNHFFTLLPFITFIFLSLRDVLRHFGCMGWVWE